MTATQEHFHFRRQSSLQPSLAAALTLTPALCASLLKKPKHGKKRGPFGWFNWGFDKTLGGYAGFVGWIIRRPFRTALVYIGIGVVMVMLFLRTPTGFLPNEDQGILFTIIQAPTGATLERTTDVIDQIEHHYLENESEAVEAVFGVAGFGFGGAGQNMGLAFVRLKDWSEREDPSLSAQAVANRAYGALSQIRDAQVFPIVPPAVPELGNVSGFDFYLQGRGG